MTGRRVLFSCYPGYGHVQPMLPLAAALRERGDEVAFATGADLVPRVHALGYWAFATGLSSAEAERRFRARFPGTDALPPDERLGVVVPNMFVDIAARERARDLVPLVQSWKPDLVVHDVTEMAAPLAAHLAGVERVAHGISVLAPDEAQTAIVAPAVQRVYADWGVGDATDVFLDATYLDICPPGLAVGGTNPFARVQPIRPGLPPATSREHLPAAIDEMPYDVTVLVTLGTVVNETPGVFEAVLDGLRDEPLNVVVTVGPDRDPGELGPQPPHVVVARYLPYSLLMPRLDAVVSHAGAGTLLGSLAAGLPSVLLPHGAEQFVNAASACAAGVAEMLPPDSIAPAAVRALVRQVLDEPCYRSAAWKLQAEIAAMPAATEVLSATKVVDVGAG